jgi:hypothetical protein
LLGGLDAAYATPALAGLGDDQAHFIARMMCPAVIAVGGFCCHGGKRVTGWDKLNYATPKGVFPLQGLPLPIFMAFVRAAFATAVSL